MPKQGGDEGVAAGLGEHALARIDQDDGEIGGGGAGRHVAGVLLMARRIGDDEFALVGGEGAIGHIDGDALFALGGEAIDEKGEIEIAALGSHFLGVGFQGEELVLEQHLGFVEQPADQGRLAVIDAAAGDEAQEVLVLLGLQIGLDIAAFEFDETGHQKYPSCFFFSMEAAWSLSMTRPWRSEEVATSISSMMSRSVVAFEFNGAGQGIAAQGAEADAAHFRLFAGVEPHALVIDHDHLAVAPDDRALGGEIERHDGNVLEVDILPDVELGPVREREDADRFALVLAGVVEVPQFGALVLGIPAVAGIAEGKNALLGAGFFLVAAGPAEGRIEAIFVEGLLQAVGLHDLGVQCRAVVEGVDVLLDAVGIDVDDEIEAEPLGGFIAEGDHVAELPAGIDMHQRERAAWRDKRPSWRGAA